MTMILYFSRNPNPRVAVAAARFMNAPVRYEHAAPLAPGGRERFEHLNPNLRLPILEEAGEGLWEADAIVFRLARACGSPFWPESVRAEADLLRWLGWGHQHFIRATDMIHFERGTKQRYGLGPIDEEAIAEGLERFRESAAILDRHLANRTWVQGDGFAPGYGDFRLATFLAFNDVAKIPLAEFPAVARWYERLSAIPAWQDPFSGLDAPALPPVM